MAVYVDTIGATAPSAKWRYKQSCHMFADTSEELDAMAERLRLRPQWKQDPFTPSEHYDLVASKRAEAIGYGAVSVERRFFVEVIERKREAGRNEV